jgi:lipid A 3-O-deacylase
MVFALKKIWRNIHMVSGFALYDYEKVWHHKAPDQLMFKVEGSIGAAHDQKTRLVSSMNIFALYYLDIFKTGKLKPYIEGGIGVIYTDFQVRGQGLRLNFNPQLGIGTEIHTENDNTYHLSLRLHHISNGGLDDKNRGINSVMGMFGYYF